jgi:hypothetical protein
MRRYSRKQPRLRRVIYIYIYYVYMYITLRFVSTPGQLQRVRVNADEGATWQLYYESCLQGIHAKQITTENTCESTTQQWRSHQWARRWNRHLEKVHTVSEYTARFTVSSHCCIQTRQISQDMNDFIGRPKPTQGCSAEEEEEEWTTLYCRFCWSNNKTSWKPVRPRVYGRSNSTIGRDSATS